MRKLREVPFSQARQRLSGMIDQVQRTGPVTILRHGKPAAVLVDHEEYQQSLAKGAKKWKLAGSLKIRKGVDIDRALKEISEEHIRQHELSLKRSVREFLDD